MMKLSKIMTPLALLFFWITSTAHDFASSPDWCQSGSAVVTHGPNISPAEMESLLNDNGVYCPLRLTEEVFDPSSSHAEVVNYIKNRLLPGDRTHGIIDEFSSYNPSQIATAYTYCACAIQNGDTDINPRTLRTRLRTGGFELVGHDDNPSLLNADETIHFTCHVCESDGF